MKPILASLIAREVAALNQALSRAGVDTKIVMVAEMRMSGKGNVPSGKVAALEVDDDWADRERFAPTTEREALVAFGVTQPASVTILPRPGVRHFHSGGDQIRDLPARSADVATTGSEVPSC